VLVCDLILSEVLCTDIARLKDEAKVWFVGLEVVVVSCAHKCQSFWNAPILLVLWPLSFPQATVLHTSQFESTDNLDQVCL
jgi:hypothetical protein